MKLVINEIPPSLNQIYFRHWRHTKQLSDYWHTLICYEAKKQKLKPVSMPVLLHFYFYKRGRPIDTDNFAIKPLVDGLRLAKVLPDDTPAWVPEIRITAQKGKKDQTIITIDPWSLNPLTPN